MVNILEKAATAVADLLAPKRHETALHEAVFADEQPTEQEVVSLCDAAGVVLGDFRRWKMTYEKRLECDQTLRVRIPQLEELARQAEQVAEAAKQPPADEQILTIGYLRGLLRAVDPKLPRGSASEIFAGLPHVANLHRNLDFAATRARRAANDERWRCEKFLLETAAAPEDGEIVSLRKQIEGAEHRIRERKPCIEAEGPLARQREVVNRIIAGTLRPPYDASVGMVPAHDALRLFLAREKAKLAALVKLASSRLADNAADQETLATLQGKLQECNSQRRARMLEPTAMRFSTD